MNGRSDSRSPARAKSKNAQSEQILPPFVLSVAAGEVEGSVAAGEVEGSVAAGQLTQTYGYSIRGTTPLTAMKPLSTASRNGRVGFVANKSVWIPCKTAFPSRS